MDMIRYHKQYFYLTRNFSINKPLPKQKRRKGHVHETTTTVLPSKKWGWFGKGGFGMVSGLVLLKVLNLFGFRHVNDEWLSIQFWYQNIILWDHIKYTVLGDNQTN